MEIIKRNKNINLTIIITILLPIPNKNNNMDMIIEMNITRYNVLISPKSVLPKNIPKNNTNISHIKILLLSR
jgi:hypothetical protein